MRQLAETIRGQLSEADQLGGGDTGAKGVTSARYFYIIINTGSASISGITATPAQLTSAVTDKYDWQLSNNHSTKSWKDEKKGQ